MKGTMKRLSLLTLAIALLFAFMPAAPAQADSMYVQFDSSDGAVWWDEVDDAAIYGVKVESADEEGSSHVWMINSTSFHLYSMLDRLAAVYGFIPEDNAYKVTVTAYSDEEGENEICSDYFTCEYTDFPPAIDVTITGTTMTWDVPGAYFYELLVEGNGGSISATDSIDLGQYIEDLLNDPAVSLQNDREDWEISFLVYDDDGRLIGYWHGMFHYKPAVQVYPAIAKLAYTSVTYDGKVKKPAVTVTANVNGTKVTLKENVDYRLEYTSKSPINVGSYGVAVIGLNPKYDCAVVLGYKIVKAKSSLAVKAKKAAVKYKKLKKKNQTIKASAAYKVSKKNGKLTYKKMGVTKKKFAKKFTVNKKNGNITVKKGLKKGTYKVKVKITDAGDKNHKSGYKNVTVTVKVK